MIVEPSKGVEQKIGVVVVRLNQNTNIWFFVSIFENSNLNLNFVKDGIWLLSQLRAT